MEFQFLAVSIEYLFMHINYIFTWQGAKSQKYYM